jgi:hypothetical protein
MKFKLIQTAALIAFLSHSSVLSANNDIKIAKTVTLNATEATQSVFQISMPENSVVTVGILGNDRFLSASENSTYVSIDLKGKTAYVKVDNPGQYSVGLGTICGVSVSIVMNVHKKDTKALASVLPKAVIKAPEKCNL